MARQFLWSNLYPRALLGEHEFVNQRPYVVPHRSFNKSERFGAGWAIQKVTGINDPSQLCQAFASQLVSLHKRVGIIQVWGNDAVNQSVHISCEVFWGYAAQEGVPLVIVRTLCDWLGFHTVPPNSLHRQ
jgi:stage V sporulation protein SpoVS